CAQAAPPHRPPATRRLGRGPPPGRLPHADRPCRGGAAGDAGAPVARVRRRWRSQPQTGHRPRTHGVRRRSTRESRVHGAGGGAHPRLRLDQPPGGGGAACGGNEAAGATRGGAAGGHGEIKEILRKEIQAADLAEIDVREVGTALEVKDGIARIYGLTSAMAGEMLEFTSSETGEKVTGQALNLEEDNIGAVIFGDYLVLREGGDVRRTR